MTNNTLTALALNCTLKPSPSDSSTQLMADQILSEFEKHDVTGDSIRIVDHEILPGVEIDMGNGEDWPAIRERVLAADILVFGTPTWLGQHSSVAQRVLERLNADMGETDEKGRPLMFDKVAIAGVVGNEDGAHHIVAILFQALNDIGFTVPAQGGIYWNGEAMQKKDYKDLGYIPDAVEQSFGTAASNAARLARLLREQG